MNVESATVYEELFVPALFGQWGERVVGAAGVVVGDRVLDVACGTGVLARAAVERAGESGSVVGVDSSAGMLAVAGRVAPGIEWRRASAEELPFEDGAFDRVLSQFGLMFLSERVAALREMLRVLRPGGTLAVAVWAALEDVPGYAALVELLQRLFGDGAADSLRAPFALGDRRELEALLIEAGVPAPRLATLEGTARFPGIRSWMHTDVRGWSPLGEHMDDERFEELVRHAESDLSAFVTPSGAVEFPAPAHVATATKA